MRNPFHKTTIARENIGKVVNDIEAWLVEAGSENLFGNRHTHSVGKPLPEGASRGFNARRFAILRVSCRF